MLRGYKSFFKDKKLFFFFFRRLFFIMFFISKSHVIIMPLRATNAQENNLYHFPQEKSIANEVGSIRPLVIYILYANNETDLSPLELTIIRDFICDKLIPLGYQKLYLDYIELENKNIEKLHLRRLINLVKPIENIIARRTNNKFVEPSVHIRMVSNSQTAHDIETYGGFFLVAEN